MYERFVEHRAKEALSDTPVVLIVGPRRAGKTTLVQKMGEPMSPDDQTALDAARCDPAGFIRGFDRAEIEGCTPTFLDRLFDGALEAGSNAIVGDDLVRLVLHGGFPEAIRRESERQRQDWALSYLTSVLMRDLKDIAVIEKLNELPKFVRLLSEYSSQLVNYSQFGGSIGKSFVLPSHHLLLDQQ